MPKRTPDQLAAQARERISRIHSTLTQIDYLCSGTLHTSSMTCGKPSCRCNVDPAARHGPYYRWGHMKTGKLVRRYVSLAQAQALRKAIANYRKMKKLIRAWETETERLINAETTPNP